MFIKYRILATTVTESRYICPDEYFSEKGAIAMCEYLANKFRGKKLKLRVEKVRRRFGVNWYCFPFFYSFITVDVVWADGYYFG